MLPLAPSVTVHVDCPLQSTLHDWLQRPLQVVLLVQASEPLPLPQLDGVKSQLEPLGQLQPAPVQESGVDEVPQPTRHNATTSALRFRLRSPYHGLSI
jgi:hypothetical protein